MGIARLSPDEVFTPNGYPIEKDNVYAARVAAEKALSEAFSRRQVPVIYGEYGVGKTTLAKYLFRREEVDGRFVHVLNVADKNLDDVARIALEHLGYVVEVGREERLSASVEGSVEAGVWATLKAKFTGKIEAGSTRKTELLVRSPTDQGFLRALADARVIVAVDEMHKASAAFRAQLAELIKAASNLGLSYPRFLILGTTTDASDLVRRDPGIDRLVREVHVSPMSDEEAQFVVTSGMKKLSLRIEEQLVERVIRTAAGAPALVQELCLDLAEQAVQEKRAEITSADLEHAVEKFLLNSQARLTQKYMLAVNTVGTRQYRKRILLAMAENPGDFATMDYLSTTVSNLVGEPVPSTSLSGPLQELKSPQYGEILADVERPETGGRRAHNLTAFKDPRMKAFIRAMHSVEEQGLSPSRDQVAALPAGDD